tara:strand:- start:3531 stop:4727 length:1197 start_codon:yes stop_codon:yes gene_type:complete
MVKYSDKFSRSPRRNQIERVGRRRDLPRIRQVRRRPTSPVLQPIYKKFGGDDIVESADTDVITAAMWSNQDGVMGAGEFHTSSVQSASSGEYYLDVYRETAAANADRESQFSIAYGHQFGSGSHQPQYASVGFSPTKAIYSQYANLLLAPDDNTFSLSNRSGSLSTEIEQVYAINIQRNRFKEKVDPANWELHISGAYDVNNVQSADNEKKIKLIDDSAISDGSVTEGGKVYKIVSGTIANGPAGTAPYTEYGLFYPDNGVMVLDTQGIDGEVGLNINSESYAYCADPVTVNNQNTTFFFDHLSDAGYFAARNKETVHASHYFIRLKNSEYNFSNNPTFTSGSQGTFTHPTFFKDPKVYITTVGMYNDNNELLAVAKLSKPLLKTYNREALIRIKLEY